MFDLLHMVLDWSGATPRRRFWWAMGAAFAALGLCLGLELWAGGAQTVPRWSFVVAALLFVPVVSLGVQRLHDAGLSGFWMLLGLIPFGILPLCLLWARRSSRIRRALYTWKPRHLWGLGLAWLLAVLLFVRAFYQPFWVPSGSMMPALLPGDYAVARLMGHYQPARGDVAVFFHTQTGHPYVKRVIGLAGDRVQLVAGQVVLNGQALPQVQMAPYAEIKAPLGPDEALTRCGNDPVGIGALCQIAQARETLPDGRSYPVLALEPQGFFDNTPEVLVPQGAVFVLGDNRDNSVDSRAALGFVPQSHMIGPIRRVIFSARGSSLLAFWTWRPNRFFQSVE